MATLEEEPNWSVVLNAIYERDMAGDSFDDQGRSPQSRRKTIQEAVGLDSEEVFYALKTLKKRLLIDDSSVREDGYKITRQGFEIARRRDERRRDRELEEQRDRRQHEVNRAIGFLTLGLLGAALLQAAIVALVNFDASLIEVNLLLVAGVGGAVWVSWLLYKSGMLKPWEAGQ